MESVYILTGGFDCSPETHSIMSPSPDLTFLPRPRTAHKQACISVHLALVGLLFLLPAQSKPDSDVYLVFLPGSYIRDHTVRNKVSSDIV